MNGLIFVSRRSVQRSLGLLALVPSASAAQSTQLSGPLISPASDVTAFAVGSMEKRVFYLADQDTQGIVELYSVPLDQHSPPIKLNDPMPSTGDVDAFLIGPSRRVVYRADPSIDGAFELFSVLVNGSRPPIRLTPPVQAGRGVTQFQLTPDGTRVVYTDQLTRLFVAPFNGSAPAEWITTIHGSYPFSIDPTSTRAFWASRETVGFSTIGYIVNAVALLPGATRVRLAVHELHAFVDAGAGAKIDRMTLSPDGQWLTYVYNYFFDGNESELDIVRTDGSQPPVRLGGGSWEFVSAADFTANSQRVVFTQSAGYSSPDEEPPALFSASPTGSRVSLNVNRFPSHPPRRIGPDGLAVFFADDGLARAPVDGSAPATALAAGQPISIEISPSGKWVAFATAANQLVSVPSAGGPVATLATGATFQYRFTSDSRHLVYRTQPVPTGARQLFEVPSNGSRPSRRLNGALPVGGTVAEGPFAIAGDLVVYLADESVRGQFELFGSPIRGARFEPAVRR